MIDNDDIAVHVLADNLLDTRCGRDIREVESVVSVDNWKKLVADGHAGICATCHRSAMAIPRLSSTA